MRFSNKKIMKLLAGALVFSAAVLFAPARARFTGCDVTEFSTVAPRSNYQLEAYTPISGNANDLVTQETVEKKTSLSDGSGVVDSDTRLNVQTTCDLLSTDAQKAAAFADALENNKIEPGLVKNVGDLRLGLPVPDPTEAVQAEVVRRYEPDTDETPVANSLQTRAVKTDAETRNEFPMFGPAISDALELIKLMPGVCSSLQTLVANSNLNGVTIAQTFLGVLKPIASAVNTGSGQLPDLLRIPKVVKVYNAFLTSMNSIQAEQAHLVATLGASAANSLIETATKTLFRAIININRDAIDDLTIAEGDFLLATGSIHNGAVELALVNGPIPGYASAVSSIHPNIYEIAVGTKTLFAHSTFDVSQLETFATNLVLHAGLACDLF